MLVALLVCLIPTTIGGLLSAIGIAGMDRLVQRNVLAMSGRAVEAAGDVRRCLLDKTGTITVGNRQATELLAVHGVTERRARGGGAAGEPRRRDARGPLDRRLVRRPSTASPRPRRPTPRWCRSPRRRGCREWTSSDSGRAIRKGAADAVRRYVAEQGGSVPPELTEFVESISSDGARPSSSPTGLASSA